MCVNIVFLINIDLTTDNLFVLLKDGILFKCKKIKHCIIQFVLYFFTFCEFHILPCKIFLNIP